MNEDLNFDDFMSYPSRRRKEIINDPESLKIMIRKNMKESRYQHSLSVANVCEELARYHHVDPRKAYLAGLLHDVCKFADERTNGINEGYLKYYDPGKLNGINGAYHSWAALYYLKEKLNFHDSDILNAIYNHTICISRDKLSMILYIADKREPLRGVEDDILDIAKKDLKKAFELLSWDVERYIREVKNERFVENSL
ncbi:MAG: bis(5'-nucleosyl)-tetraphosphatase (symmetrical) YqeK [Erysipelotrichaceae bacterium]|nr:bis(5'-nucleosyl)-tetraphosphatase (symmetrical) YqeK [Erysipelotrichaceae bacterium]